jgi:uncharacterized protein
MNKLMKILAFISIFVLLAMFTGTVSATNSTVNPQNSIQTVTNNTHNSTLMLNNTNVSSYAHSYNLNRNISQKNTTGIIMATTDYNCGPAALATVMRNYFGINATQDQLEALAGTDENGTSMYGLQQAAQKEGLIAKGMSIPVNHLVQGNIVYLTMAKGNGHFCVIAGMTNNTIYLADPDLGNINMTYSSFKTIYKGYGLVITNNSSNPQLNGKALSNVTMQSLVGTATKNRSTQQKLKRFVNLWADSAGVILGGAMMADGAVSAETGVGIGLIGAGGVLALGSSKAFWNDYNS